MLSGNKIISNIVSLTANENGEYEVYMTDLDSDGLCDPLEDYLGTDKNNSDTDSDGLSDYEELYYTQTDPLKFDTNGDGICDADKDIDEDGLSFRQELDLTTNSFRSDTDSDGLSDGDEVNIYGTDPLKKDTDNDGLIDGKELDYSCDPLNPDSNYDGVLDGDDIYTVTKKSKESDSKVSVELTIDIPGSSIENLSIDEVPEDDIFLPSQMPGYIGNGFNFYVDCEFDEATMKYTFDESFLEIEDFEPAVYYCDVVNQKMILLEDQEIDLDNCTVTAKTTHFSRYILLNKTEFEKIWDEDFIDGSTDKDGNVIGMEIALVIDSSGSMGWNDSSGIRKDAAKQFVDNLRDEDKAAIIDFDSYAYIYQGLTNDKGMLYNAINRIDSNGGTSLSAGISKGLESLLASDSDAKKIIVMLTDGDGSYSSNYTQQAIANDITIYTIGLGTSINTNVLTTMAEATGGKYYYASSAKDLTDKFDDVQKDIGTKDTDGDGLPDNVERNLYWFNGVRLNFDPDNTNSFDDDMTDSELLTDYSQISEGIYEAKIKFIDPFLNKLKEWRENYIEFKNALKIKRYNRQVEMCEELDDYGNIIGDSDIGHHILTYHEDSHCYECEYCDAVFEDPNYEDEENLYEEDRALFYTLNRMQDYYTDYEKNNEIVFGIERIKDNVRKTYNCNNSNNYKAYCLHMQHPDGYYHGDETCTPYSCSDLSGEFISPDKYCLNKNDYKLTNYDFEASTLYITYGSALFSVTLEATFKLGRDIFIDKAISKFFELEWKGQKFGTKEQELITQGLADGATDIIDSNCNDRQDAIYIMQKTILQSAIDSGIESIPYLGKAYMVYNLASDFVDYINEAASDISLPCNYRVGFQAFVKTNTGADRIESNFDVCRLYVGYSSDYSFIFYDPRNNYVAYDDSTTMNNHIDKDSLDSYPFESYQIGNYADINFLKCPTRNDFSIKVYKLR